MLEDDVFLLDILILDKFFFIEEAGVVYDLVIGSYGVGNELTWVESMRLGTDDSNKYDNIDNFMEGLLTPSPYLSLGNLQLNLKPRTKWSYSQSLSIPNYRFLVPNHVTLNQL
jgi:hypothetical protein